MYYVIVMTSVWEFRLYLIVYVLKELYCVENFIMILASLMPLTFLLGWTKELRIAIESAFQAYSEKSLSSVCFCLCLWRFRLPLAFGQNLESEMTNKPLTILKLQHIRKVLPLW